MLPKTTAIMLPAYKNTLLFLTRRAQDRTLFSPALPFWPASPSTFFRSVNSTFSMSVFESTSSEPSGKLECVDSTKVRRSSCKYCTEAQTKFRSMLSLVSTISRPCVRRDAHLTGVMVKLSQPPHQEKSLKLGSLLPGLQIVTKTLSGHGITTLQVSAPSLRFSNKTSSSSQTIVHALRNSKLALRGTWASNQDASSLRQSLVLKTPSLTS